MRQGGRERERWQRKQAAQDGLSQCSCALRHEARFKMPMMRVPKTPNTSPPRPGGRPVPVDLHVVHVNVAT